VDKRIDAWQRIGRMKKLTDGGLRAALKEDYITSSLGTQRGVERTGAEQRGRQQRNFRGREGRKRARTECFRKENTKGTSVRRKNWF